jgi:hypothetical protein
MHGVIVRNTVIEHSRVGRRGARDRRFPPGWWLVPSVALGFVFWTLLLSHVL